MQRLPPVLTTILMYSQHFAARFLRPMTLGVRTIVIDRNNRVLLVRHSYIKGWHLPGGGVDAGEVLHDAMARELKEETGATLTGPAKLHGVFYNNRYSRRDHVMVYVVRDFHIAEERQPDWEIREVKFFDSSDLPPDVTRATRERIAEALGDTTLSEMW